MATKVLLTRKQARFVRSVISDLQSECELSQNANLRKRTLRALKLLEKKLDFRKYFREWLRNYEALRRALDQ